MDRPIPAVPLFSVNFRAGPGDAGSWVEFSKIREDSVKGFLLILLFSPWLAAGATPPAQAAAGNAGTIEVTVADPSGAVLAGAAVKVENRASHFSREPQTGANGVVRLTGVPPNVYHVEVSAAGFQTQSQDVTVRASVPVLVKISYFPNWEVDGAKGPYRVAPNFMVVIPTSKHVRLHYEASGSDMFFYLLTLAGIGLAVFWRIRGDVRHASPHPFFVTPGAFDDEDEDDFEMWTPPSQLAPMLAEADAAGSAAGDDGVTDDAEGSSPPPDSV